MEEMAMKYEMLIRQAHNCLRHGVTGANADDFRGLEASYIKYRDAKKMDNDSPEDIQELIADYMRRVGEISAYLRTSIDKVEKENNDRLSQAQKDELNEIRSLLRESDMDKIDEAITRTETVFDDLKL